MKVTKTKLHLMILTALLMMSSCFKQKPKVIKSEGEIVEVGRLEACTKMNLFNNLFDHENIKSTFQCTQWNLVFPTLFDRLNKISAPNWDHLMMPVSENVLNEKENLRKLIAISQKLDSKGGLIDLGNVIGSLSDTNFYDGLNKLFECSEKSCTDRNNISKNQIVELLQIINILKDRNNDIHEVLAQSVEGLSVLSPNFSKKFAAILHSPSFKSDRMEMMDLLISIISVEKTEFEQKLFSDLLSANESNPDSIWGWINSGNFSDKLFKDIIKFNENNVNAIKDLRSISQINSKGLSCNSANTALFFVNIERHLLDLINVFATKNDLEIVSFLENDLTQHQITSDACQNFKNIEVTLDGKKHQLSVMRLKRSLVEFIRIPGVFPLVRIVAKIINDQAGLSEKVVNQLLEKYSDKNYLGAAEKFLRIINDVEPDVLKDYEKYLKAMPAKTFESLSGLFAYILKKENHKSWIALGDIWNFFNSKEKDFLFNYIDKHFESESNYTALFEYYIDLYTVLNPYLPSLVDSWVDSSNKDKTYDAIQEIAMAFNGDDVLSDFRKFFSREHLVKVIELFVNGESLLAWAQEIASLIPQTSRNDISFSFVDTFHGSSSECLDRIISSNLDILIRDFPAPCNLTSQETLLGKMSILSDLSKDYLAQYGIDLISKDNFLNQNFLQSLILSLKKSSNEFDSEIDFEKYLKFQSDKILSQDAYSILKILNQYLHSFDLDDQIIIKRRILKKISELLSTKEDLESLSGFMRKIGSAHESGAWNNYQNPKYPAEISSNKCTSVLNQNIGGAPCPSLLEFKEFLTNFTGLLVRKNDDESPLAARQFLKALDPAKGLPIPLGSRNPKFKNLSLKESLKMFVDFTDKEKEINSREVEYETDESSTFQKTTLMERIEIVIRDVNFDENYLGAHYKNAVAKSYNYNEVVESKYKLFNICVKAGFCGKFMSRHEKKMARNAVRTFPSLLQANEGEFEYGDYMKALLGSVVSSSSKASQISSIVKFKKNDDGFNIPWIQTKKQLRKHNGKILSELAMVSAFSNMARWTRDRFARSKDEFDNFINSKNLNYINENFLKNLNDKVSDVALTNLMDAVGESDGILIKDIYSKLNELNYDKLRALEFAAGDLLVVISSLSKLDVNFNYEESLGFLTWVIKNYAQFKQAWPKDLDIVDLILELKPYLALLSDELEREDKLSERLMIAMAKYIDQILFNSEDELSIFKILSKNITNSQARKLVELTDKGSTFLSSLSRSDQSDYYKNIYATANIINIETLVGFQQYFKMSSSTRSCEQRGELVYCRDNNRYLEPWKIVDYFSEDGKRWHNYAKGLINPPHEVSKWLYQSLKLIQLPVPAPVD